MTTPGDELSLLRSIVCDVTGKEFADIDPNTPVAELGIDSVLVAEIVIRIEDTLGIELSALEWMSVRTLQDFVNLIKAKRQRQV